MIAAVRASAVVALLLAVPVGTAGAQQRVETPERIDRVASCPGGQAFVDGKCIRVPLEPNPDLRVRTPAAKLSPASPKVVRQVPLLPIQRRCDDGTPYGEVNAENDAVCIDGELVGPCEHGTTNAAGEYCYHGVYYPVGDMEEDLDG